MKTETGQQLDFFSSSLNKDTKIPQSSSVPPIQIQSQPDSQRDGIYEQVHQYFTEQDADEKNILFIREVLGSESEQLTDEEINNCITETQYLIDQWLDEFEMNTFGGTTLRELLGTG